MNKIKQSRISAVKTAVVITLCFIILLALSATAKAFPFIRHYNKPTNRHAAKAQRNNATSVYRVLRASKLKCPHTGYAIYN